MGHRPKSLLLLDGEPLIRRQVHALQTAGAAQLVVVLGHYAADIGAQLQGLNIQVIHNPQPDDGLVSSQRLGLQALPDGLDGVVMALADQPLIEAADISALTLEFQSRPAGIDMVFPKVDGAPGNPVMLSAAARRAILLQGPAFGCKEWRQAHQAQVRPLASSNLHFTTDLDHLADLAAFTARTGRSLTWPADWTPQ
jgi:molybdenum cofactor cytidylyltransferase